MLLAVGIKAAVFTPSNSKMQTDLFAQVDGVAPAHAIPAVTRKTVAGNLEGKQMLSLKLEPSKESRQWVESICHTLHSYMEKNMFVPTITG